MTLRLRERELAAVGISVAAGCKPCTDYHIGAARKAKAADDDIRQAVNHALRVRGGATVIMVDHALAQLGVEERRGGDRNIAGEADRISMLLCLGVAFVVNCTTSFERYLVAAVAAGIPGDDIAEIVKLATFIRGKAVSHVERAAGLPDRADDSGGEAATG